MTRIIIVGVGPGGLSAALFLAKNGHETTVLGTDQTAMHYAYLYNYLGFPEIAGTELQARARAQVESHGAVIRKAKVESIAANERFEVTVDGGETLESEYLILTEGKNPVLAKTLELATDDSGAIVVDRDYRSSRDRVYVVGRSARPERSQAIISAGAGATAALDILALEAGKSVQDWDTPPKE